ncbi:type A chloramphenicol O-acetyltransferase [Zophobihabitans entericus]|uniref:Chloramphenicol acetyltransferase n=1 Tax=Zophobihabitans entericus TaxID=1635327 RepID=A0A6G9IAZ2_9GAMM|nr:type A chloramphenicol O-acetyltransferase [Zophobihabitans entericus]QIQ21396.1 type A chloramphenicol O-acetyltransferase [Zophobihabitans entericus]
MNFNLLDLNNWTRKSYYLHYMNNLPCTYSLTVNINITGLLTALKKRHKKIYPAQIYMLTTIVNQHKEFRMSLDSQGKLGYWSELNPGYTILNKESETFASIWTEYQESFIHFYQNCMNDTNAYSQATSLFPQELQPVNFFNISSLPWVNFTSFNLNVLSNNNYLLPIFTLGKFIEQDNQILMPLAIQVHHAVCDGFHVGRFVNDLQELANNYRTWVDQ